MKQEEIEAKLAVYQRIIDKVVGGETTPCPVCGTPLEYITTYEDKHPGIYCPVNDKHFSVLQDYETEFPQFNLNLIRGAEYLKVGCVNITIKTTKGILEIDNIQKIDTTIGRLYYKIRKDEKAVIKFIDLNKILSVRNNCF